MKSRALGVTAVASHRIFASTFHTFCLGILKLHGELVGCPPDFELLDVEEQDELAQRAALSAGVPNALGPWNYARLRREVPEARTVERFGKTYQDLKRSQNCVDFDDLIVFVADLFGIEPNLAAVYSARYEHLLVDEFQDTNAAQFVIVSGLAKGARTVSVFADDDQAIYQFAGAEYENVVRFSTALGAVQYHLSRNYRCREAIALHANRLIHADPAASGRTMNAVYSGGSVRSLTFDAPIDEAMSIVGELVAKTAEGSDPSSFAILSRARNRLRQIIDVLERGSVPFANWIDPIIRIDQRALMRTCFSVARGSLDDRQARKLFALLGCNESAERDPVKILEDSEGTSGSGELRQLREAVWNGVPMLDLMDIVVRACAAIDPSYVVTAEAVKEAVRQLLQFDPDFGVDHLFAEFALGSGLQTPSQAGVKVSTLHGTKGLQWEHVYLVGLEEDTLPSYWAKTAAELREERRSCFVGVTRAELDLTMTRVRHLNGFAKAPSRFLNDMFTDRSA
jgi:DNA helicase-2/ATP-dependent DNA helicase PcrA